jgi:hypothetical protein
LQESSLSARKQYRQAVRSAGAAAASRITFRSPKNSSSSSSSSSGSAGISATAVTSASSTTEGSSSDKTVSASGLLLLAAASFIWQGFVGWGYPLYYSDYYSYWRQAYFLNNIQVNVNIPARVNPCKYYSNWAADNDITFGAIVSNSGVLDFAARSKSDPVGLAFPQVAVRGNNMLITYSYAGLRQTPDGSGTPAYPGETGVT